MKLTFFTFFLLFFQLVSFSQENTVEEDNTLGGQFDKIYRTSTSYQVYKVIGKDRFQKLKENVLDSISKANKEIKEKELLLKSESDKVSKLNSELSNTAEKLNKASEKENSISLFGIQLSKLSYNLILWGIIITISLGLIFFIFKYSNSHILTKKAQENLIDVEQEFEVFRKKSLAREQKLRRQLQDEINKHRSKQTKKS